MKRFLAIALVFGSFSALGLTGCSEGTKESVEIKKDGPNGSVVEKDTKEIKATGDQKPNVEGAK